MKSATSDVAKEYFTATLLLCGEIRGRVSDDDMEASGEKESRGYACRL